MSNDKKKDKERRYFVLIGSAKNWKTSLNHNLWGFTEKSKGLWNKTNPKDLLAFYVTLPIGKVIGFGHVGKKFINDDLIWNDEKLFKNSIWKYKFEIIPSYICKNFEEGVELPYMVLGTSRKAVNEETFASLVKGADSHFNTNLFKEYFIR